MGHRIPAGRVVAASIRLPALSVQSSSALYLETPAPDVSTIAIGKEPPTHGPLNLNDGPSAPTTSPSSSERRQWCGFRWTVVSRARFAAHLTTCLGRRAAAYGWRFRGFT